MIASTPTGMTTIPGGFDEGLVNPGHRVPPEIGRNSLRRIGRSAWRSSFRGRVGGLTAESLAHSVPTVVSQFEIRNLPGPVDPEPSSG